MKFSLAWLGEFVDVSAAGGPSRARALLEQAGFPVESSEAAPGDTILDVEITPNRPDAMNHRGLARELAAMARVPFAAGPAAAEKVGAGGENATPAGPDIHGLTSIEIAVPRLCRRFGARLVRGIAGAPAPENVRARLAAIGAKSISAAVDATNYVLWEIGQPLHAFDFDKLSGGLLVVRRARRGERLTLLDGTEHVLDASDVVVADAERAVSLAGIMGGLETAVTRETRNVLLEAAWWDPVSIRRTSRRLGLHTDASHRFERGADPEAIPEALARAAEILVESAGGEPARGWIDARGAAVREKRATLRISRLRLLAGDDRLDLELAEEALRRLGFAVTRRGRRVTAGVPSWRPDVSIEDDLAEEVLRVYGYDRLPSRLPPARGAGGYLEPLRLTEERLADGAASAGLLETQASPFVDRARDEGAFAAWLSAAGSAMEPLSVENPLDASRRDLRATLLPGLLDAAALNEHRGERAVGLFEVGRVFDRAGDPADPPSFESRRFGFALAGEWRAHWSVPATERAVDFFDAKGLVERLLSPWIAPDALRWKPFAADAFTPGAAALVEHAPRASSVEPAPRATFVELSPRATLGVVGLLSASEMERRKLAQPLYTGEILIDAIPPAPERTAFSSYSSFPRIDVDVSFTHPRDTPWESIERFIREERLPNLAEVEPVGRYDGPGTPADRVKTTVRLAFRSMERTLSQEEVNRERDRLMSALKETFGAEL